MSKQFFKAIYFRDYPAVKSQSKSFTVAYNENEKKDFDEIHNLTNEEIRELIGISSYKKLEQYAKKEDRSVNQIIKRFIKQRIGKRRDNANNITRDVTFIDSKSTPFQRWYPYIEGYSLNFVRELIKEYGLKDKTIYDPFAGTGTTLIASDIENTKVLYSEVNPLLQFLIATKIHILKLDHIDRIELANDLTKVKKNLLKKINKCKIDIALQNNYITLFSKSIYFPENTYNEILKLRSLIDEINLQNVLLGNTLTIAVLACLLPISYLKKVGDVRFKTQKEIDTELKTVEEVLPKKIDEMIEDILNFDFSMTSSPELIIANAKNIGKINNIEIDAIITSPPYLNGTNYFRNTKIELWFLKHLQYEKDLRHFRNQALTSGINDVKKDIRKDDYLGLNSISPNLKHTLSELEKNSYDARIPKMAKSYFEEMYTFFNDLTSSLNDKAKIIIDIGDSIFSNIHIKTDLILVEILKDLGYKLLNHKLLRKRRSKNKQVLSQSLLVFQYERNQSWQVTLYETKFWQQKWDEFKLELPHQKLPFSKRNWGHPNHSLCSYQGKLKPSIARNLIKTFIPENGKFLDPFAGVGTLPFEGALSGLYSYGFDISLPAFYISTAKVGRTQDRECYNYIELLENFIKSNHCTKTELEETTAFGFNKKLVDYYEPKTLQEIILARRFFKEFRPKNTSEMLVISSLLHILHGNRPYALSRNSHPIVPYAPTGEFIYKNLVSKLKEKVLRVLQAGYPNIFQEGKIFLQDATSIWPQEVCELDAIITSPPFFDSTRFYVANWLRIWFAGWQEIDFKQQISSFIEEKQKVSFKIYEPIFRQARERLKKDGVFVLHLGKSVKCDMANELKKVANKWFRAAEIFDENVEHCESHGIRDKGTVTSHQYLVLT